MASLSYDSELMTNYVAAVPVPAGSHFVTCLDPSTRTPVVFALSNDAIPRLHMIKQGPSGLRQLVDLSALLQIPEKTLIQTFDAQQGPDLKVYLVVATRFDDSKSNVLVVKAFDISDSPTVSLFPVKTIGAVSRIYMSPPSAGISYPMVFGIHQPLESLTKSSEITRILVSLRSNSWAPMRNMELPVNAVDIFDITPAHSVFGDGLIVLCAIKESQERTIIAEFYTEESGAPEWYNVKLKCPQGANALSTFTNKAGNSALLIAGSEGLRYMNGKQILDKGAEGTLISSDSLLKNSRELFVSQDNDFLSIWASNSEGQLSYINTTGSDIASGRAAVVPLLDSGRAATFAACITKPAPEHGRPAAWQTLVLNDEHGNLTLLQQHKDTGIWKYEPFAVPYPTKNVPVESYTISVQLAETNGKTTPKGAAFVRSSSAAQVIMNGRVQFLSSTGSWLESDDAGELNFIIPTNTIAGQVLTITQVRTAEGAELPFKTMTLDPSKKVLESFGRLTSVEDLKSARTKDNQPLWEAKDLPSKGDLAQAAKCFQAMHQATIALPTDGTSVLKTANTMATMAVSTTGQMSDDLGDLLMDGFSWVKEKLEDAIDWIVEKVGDAWRFVCRIGDAIKTFALDCLEKIGEAASWVFEKIKIGWEKLKDFVGFIFDWADFIETKNSIKAILNAGLDLGAEKMDEFVPKIDDFFAGIQDQVIQSLSPASQAVGSQNSKNSGQKTGGTQSSTSYKWTGERLKNGNSGSGGAVIHSEAPSTEDSWENDFKPLLDTIEAAALQTGNDISTLFKKAGSVTTADLLSTGSKFLVNVLEVVKQFTITLTKSIKRLLKLLKEIGNKRIDLWIFSDLYESWTGNELTLFDAVSLIIAIPTCIMIKVVTGAKPPNFTSIDGKKLGLLLSGDTTVPTNERLDFNTLTAGVALGVVSIKGIYSIIKLAYKAVTEGADAALGTFSPGKTMNTISIILDILGAINAMAGDPSLPAPKCRQWIAILSLIRAGSNGLGLILPESEAFSKVNKVYERVNLCIELVVTLANFGLYQAVYYYEIEEQWDDKDVQTTSLAMVGNTLNAIAGIGSFTANMGKLHAPHMTAVGVVVMTVGTYGLLAMEGIMFERQYEKGKESRMIVPSF